MKDKSLRNMKLLYLLYNNIDLGYHQPLIHPCQDHRKKVSKIHPQEDLFDKICSKSDEMWSSISRGGASMYQPCSTNHGSGTPCSKMASKIDPQDDLFGKCCSKGD